MMGSFLKILLLCPHAGIFAPVYDKVFLWI